MLREFLYDQMRMNVLVKVQFTGNFTPQRLQNPHGERLFSQQGGHPPIERFCNPNNINSIVLFY